ncbi:CBS domain-containing protein [Halocella sp. SP3-1]|uniref:CBS domain-containing protein n=1 Tax=Halocella sp. SP3-1 TaxID=2382161 RepID=UPI000F75215C|nr:CBS domain-containing protein [Halocella sp. SP3-1]AZO93680.1 CBS domain-containing protein [Halocella sp. SP3-1]
MGIVKDYMMRTLVSVCEDDQIKEAIRIMYKAEMSVLPVVNSENKFLGTIYSENILKNILPEKYGYLVNNRLLYEVNQAAENLIEVKERGVKEYMSTRTSVVMENDKMYKIADVMLDNKESILFVVNESGNLRGYISRADLLYYLLKVCNKQDE